MNLPNWNDPSLTGGTKVRTALWLVGEVGIGNLFTKEQLRSAFPGITQADRRLRDLRPHGWIIHTKAQDLTLNAEEQRFVAMGEPIWEGRNSAQSAPKALTAKKRMRVLAENDYQCTTCGIAGGESYPDAPHVTAILSISRRPVCLLGGKREMLYVPECKLCAAGFQGDQIDLAALVNSVTSLNTEEKTLFARWIKDGRRGGIDRIWATFRRLPAEAKMAIREQIALTVKTT
jgi:hypothetical protein